MERVGKVVQTSIASDASPARRVTPRVPRLAGAAAPVPGGVGRAVWATLLGPPAPSAALVDALQALALCRRAAPGSRLLSRHEPAHELLVLAEGDAALGCVQEGTPFRPERSLQGPAWLDASSAWLGGPPAQDALALGHVTLLALPLAALQPLLAGEPDLARRLLLVLAHRVHQLTTVAHDLMYKAAEARFADWLLQHCRVLPDAPGRAVVTLHERKRDIAAQLGITPETLSRLLRQLGRKGLIEVKGYSVALQDLAALRALAAS